MEAGTVTRELCTEKHKRVDEQIGRINNHGERIKELESGSEVQSKINDIFMEQLQELMAWKKEQEAKPARRISKVVDIIVQWATLLILGLLALKIGLQ